MNIFEDQIISEALFNDIEESARCNAITKNNNNKPIIGIVTVLLTFDSIKRKTQRRVCNRPYVLCIFFLTCQI